MEPLSISALAISIGSIIAYIVRKKLKTSSCTSSTNSCTSTMQLDLSDKDKKELYEDLRAVKHDIINELSPHILKFDMELKKIKDQLRKEQDKLNQDNIEIDQDVSIN